MQKLISIVIITAALLSVLSTDALPESKAANLFSDTVSTNGHTYQIVFGNFTWDAAKSDAEARAGHLATFTNETEWAFVTNAFGSKLLGLYLGGSDVNQEGVWEWVTGEKWSFANWNEGQPDNSSGVQNYLWLHPAYGLNWDDTAAEEVSGYLLELEDSDGDGLTDAYEIGYSRYQLITGSVTWANAKLDAEHRGGHLATITSVAEWNFVLSQFGSQFLGKSTAIGATDEAQEGVWKWVTGEPFNFSFWMSGEPNNSEGNENAISITPYEGSPWNDAAINSEFDQYLLEFGYPTDPSKSDSDGDGFPDKEEIDAGANPLDPLSTPKLKIYHAVEIEFPTVNGTRYQVEQSSDAKLWNPFGDIIIGDGNLYSRLYSIKGTGAVFYRVKELP